MGLKLILIITACIIAGLIILFTYMKKLPLSVIKFIGFLIVMAALAFALMIFIRKLQEKHSWN